MRALMSMLGLPEMATDQLVIFLVMVAIALLLLAWIADMTLGDSGYGILLNGVVMLAGAIGGVLLWRKLGYHPNIHPQAASALVAAVSGMVLLLAGSIARRWL